MRAAGQREKVSQTHLARSAAVIGNMAKSQGRKLAQPPRYGFIHLQLDQVLVFKARPGAKTVMVDGRRLEARAPKGDLEREAVEKFEARGKVKPKKLDVVAVMANKIVETKGRGVERRDFHQAGIADDSVIDAHFGNALALARRIDPKIDAMVATP